MKNQKKSLTTARIIRWGVLAGVLITSTVLGLMHQYWPASRVVGVDALCPFGGIEAAYTLIASGEILKKAAVSSFILMGGVLAIAFIARRSFCGQICPLGFLQEIFGKIGDLIFRKKKPIMPAIIDKPARFLKYGALALIIGMSIYTTSLWFRPYDPWATYHHLLSSELLTGFAVGLGILVVSLVGSVVYDRFFCRYLCPMGAFLALISKLSWFKVRRDAELCIDCGKCDKACPVAVKVSNVAVVESPECINCNECVTACPAAGALEVKAPNGKKTSPLAAILITLGILSTVVGGTTAAGLFGWTTKTLAQEVEKSGGKFDPDQIKGKSTFREISEASGIPKSAFIKEYNLTEKDMDAEIKTFEEDRGFGPEEIREFVEAYLKTGKPPVKTEVETKQETLPKYDTAEIKASMTPRQTADASGVPLPALQEEFAITDGQADTPLKDIKGIAGFAEIDEIRIFIDDYLKTH